jgi:hypothetical protein
MNASIKAQWLAALRGKEYKQGRNQLHHTDDNTFCCLGVLCDIQSPAGRGTWYGAMGFPPPELRAGLFMGDCGRLSRLNDVERKSFREIADYVEANF